MAAVTFALLLTMTPPAFAEMRAGVGVASITPLEEGITTQLGGYGAREGAPAEGIHDTINAKVLLFDADGKRAALVGLDICSIPIGLTRDALEKAGIAGLSVENTLMSASHTHAGLEGFALDERNIADNPHIGIFSPEMLEFTATRVAEALQAAEDNLQPVHVGAATSELPGMSRNRRGDECTDSDMTVLRVDRMDGTPLAVHVNYTAHGTIMTEHEMLISGGWAGVMQRTCEALLGDNVTCLYTNGAVGDISPAGHTGGSRWEAAEDYGRRVGIASAELARMTETRAVPGFHVAFDWIALPEQQAAPDFLKIAGDEYNVSQEQLEMNLPVMFPSEAPVHVFRIGDFAMATLPGEPICVYGLEIKDALREAGAAHPCVAGLTTDHIGYILTPEEYRESGYEVTASFYGETLGPVIIGGLTTLIQTVAR